MEAHNSFYDIPLIVLHLHITFMPSRESIEKNQLSNKDIPRYVRNYFQILKHSKSKFLIIAQVNVSGIALIIITTTELDTSL